MGGEFWLNGKYEKGTRSESIKAEVYIRESRIGIGSAAPGFAAQNGRVLAGAELPFGGPDLFDG
jgi:hypothetical protein